jgi:hypothetical protein
MMGKHTVEDGGAAFPVVHPDGSGVQYFGMSIRDYFAAKAMAALTPVYWEDFESFGTGKELTACLVETAYEMADAMLLQRNKGSAK